MSAATKPCACCNDTSLLRDEDIDWTVAHITRAAQPICDMCEASPAEIDAPLKSNLWAQMCGSCWQTLGKHPNELGLGIGQRLEVTVAG